MSHPANCSRPDHSAACLIDVIDKAVPADSGSLIAWDGQKIPF
jgi:hypothetical protein